MGRLSNGELILAAEGAGFDLLITADRNLRYQQNLVDRWIAILVIATNNWSVIQRHGAAIEIAVAEQSSGTWRELNFPN